MPGKLRGWLAVLTRGSSSLGRNGGHVPRLGVPEASQEKCRPPHPRHSAGAPPACARSSTAWGLRGSLDRVGGSGSARGGPAVPSPGTPGAGADLAGHGGLRAGPGLASDWRGGRVDPAGPSAGGVLGAAGEGIRPGGGTAPAVPARRPVPAGARPGVGPLARPLADAAATGSPRHGLGQDPVHPPAGLRCLDP
jgi:hypothetical protein